MSSPLLTVILPVYNGMPFAREAVESILRQTYADFRMIAINDGSTDGSAEYLESVRDPRFAVVHQQRAGLGAVLNRGIDLCETPFLARMDADDIALPLRFEQQMECLRKDQGLVAVSSPLDFLVCGQLQRGLPYPTEHAQIVHELLNGGAGLSHPALLMRTDAARAVRYRIAGAGEDLDFCLRLAEYGRVANLDTVQYIYRIHGASISMTKRADLECGYAYAVHTALERRQGLRETSLQEFQLAWSKRSVGERLHSWRLSVSYTGYRRARLEWARRQHFAAVGHMAISVGMQPMRSARLAFRRARFGRQGSLSVSP